MLSKDTPEVPPGSSRQLTVSRPARPVMPTAAAVVVPALIADTCKHLTCRFLEFFAAAIRNRNKGQAYLHATAVSWRGASTTSLASVNRLRILTPHRRAIVTLLACADSP